MGLAELVLAISAHRRVSATNEKIDDLHEEVQDRKDSLSMLRQDIERLYLIIEALWAILREATDLTDADLQRIIQDIDLQDGTLDGRNRCQNEVLRCSACGKVILRGHAKCAYCGAPTDGASPFRHAGR